MGIAGLILGIISLVLGWIPVISILALIMAIVGLILSIVDTAKKSKTNDPSRGTSIAGIIVSAIAIIISGIITFFFLLGVIISVSDAIDSDDVRDAFNRIDDGYYDYYDDYYDYNYNFNKYLYEYDL